MDHLVDDEGDVPLGLLARGVRGEPGGEARLQRVEERGREAPEVHRDARVAGEVPDRGGGIVVVRAGRGRDELHVFDDLGEAARRVERADAARDAPVRGERAVETVADHSEGEGAGCRGACAGRREEGGELLEGVAAVEVVGVDGGEGLAHDVARGADRVRGAPGLRAPGGDRVGRGEVGDVLEGVFDGEEAGVLRADLRAEDLFDVRADDEDDLAEPGAVGVEDGVVENGLAGGTDGVDLLEPAVAGAHAGGEDDECRFGVHVVANPFVVVCHYSTTRLPGGAPLRPASTRTGFRLWYTFGR